MQTSTILRPIIQSIREWRRVRADTYAASIAYYGLFALAPILLFSVVIAGFILGPIEARTNALNIVQEYAGSEVATLVGILMEQVRITGSNTFFLIVAFFITFFGAMRVFTALRNALYHIWEVDHSKEGIKHIARSSWQGGLLTFLTGFLLLLSVVISTLYTSFRSLIPDLGIIDDLILTGGEILFSLLFPLLLIHSLLLILPPTRPKLSNTIIPTGIVTLALFILKYAFALYINLGTTSAYGAASTLVIFLLWMYFMATIFLFGAKMTYEYEKQS